MHRADEPMLVRRVELDGIADCECTRPTSQRHIVKVNHVWPRVLQNVLQHAAFEERLAGLLGEQWGKRAELRP